MQAVKLKGGPSMHAQVVTYIREALEHLPPRLSVLEFGGRNINGTVRGLFQAPAYLSIDLVSGPGVDLVADAASYKHNTLVDTVVCCEVLEHTPKWPFIVMAAGRSLDPDKGVLLLTCACHPRAPHSATDGGQVRQGEYYGNVDPLQLSTVLDQAGFVKYEIDCDEQAGDLRVTAWRADK